MKFVPNQELDAKRERLRDNYDRIMLEIRKCQRGGQYHLQLLEQEKRAAQETWHFLKANNHYFSQKRRNIFGIMEKKGAFGEAPRSNGRENVDGRTGNIISNWLIGRKTNRANGIFDKIGVA